MTNVAYIIISVLCFVPAIVLHECGHAFMAYKLGDPTAKNAGRLTLNPLKHVDPLGTVILPVVMMLMGGPVFGYAKPVPYNPAYFEDKRKGDILVAVAGPGVNLLLALAACAVAWIFRLVAGSLLTSSFAYYVVYFLMYFTLINLFLMFFNLIPIPPLDGSAIFVLLPERFLPTYYTVQRYAMPFFLILVFVIPAIFNVNPIGVYLNWAAGGFYDLLFPAFYVAV